jgi:hypothetical protein
MCEFYFEKPSFLYCQTDKNLTESSRVNQVANDLYLLICHQKTLEDNLFFDEQHGVGLHPVENTLFAVHLHAVDL